MNRAGFLRRVARSRGLHKPGLTLAMWCFALAGICAAGVVLRAESGIAHAAELALAQGTDLNLPDVPADAPTDTPTNPDGGSSNPSDLNSGPATYTLSLLTDGTSTGIINASPSGGPIYPNKSVVTLTASPVSTAEFAGWAGACAGVLTPTCTVVMDADKSVTATFNLKTTKLRLAASGGSISGVSAQVGSQPQTCLEACTWTYPIAATSRVTLTAIANQGYIFKEWTGGACLSTTNPVCALTFDTDTTATAVFVPILRIGAVFSSAQPASRSFLRFHNTGTAGASAALKIYNPVTNQLLGTWTTPIVLPGTAPQYSIGQIEEAIGMAPTAARPDYYSIAIESTMNGFFQHVLWRSSDGTLTNLSTCGTGVTIDGRRVANVHASTFDSAYPSSVVVSNTGLAAAGAVLGIYNASTNAQLGTYTILSVPAGGRVVVRMREIEVAADITPSSAVPHYTVKIESTTFTGFLQHLVSNVQAGVITDMTTVCSFTGNPATNVASTLTPSLIYSTAQSSSRSFLRFYNSGAAAGTASVVLYDYATGRSLGQWTSPSVPAGSEQQFFIGDIESAIPAETTKPDYYSASIEAKFSGNVQHVLWRSSNATLTNLSTCAAAVIADPLKLAGVHSSLLNGSYPSSVVINNTGVTAVNGPTMTLGIYDARTGAKLGDYLIPNVPPNGSVVVPVSLIETQANVTPGEGMYHYVIKAETPFTGFLQHLVNNTTAGVVTDMTTACGLRASGVTQ